VIDDAYRVLVIDDDVDLAEYTRTILERRAGCRVVVVNDPMQARAVAVSLLPDVVITDVVMPGMTGFELLDQLRLDRPGLPVIVMTGHQAIYQRGGALQHAASELHMKPVSSATLITSVLGFALAWRATEQLAS
jgi:DNA-binding NtrC family response regulator